MAWTTYYSLYGTKIIFWVSPCQTCDYTHVLYCTLLFYIFICFTCEIKGHRGPARGTPESHKSENLPHTSLTPTMVEEIGFVFVPSKAVLKTAEYRNVNVYLLKSHCYLSWQNRFIFRIHVLKGIVHPKMKILSVIIHPHVVPNL